MLIVGVTAVGGVAAQDPAPPVYTTQDLERMFGPPAPVSPEPPLPAADEWAWVESFLERQHARLDERRRLEWELQLAEQRLDQERAVRVRPLYAFPLALGYRPWGGWHRPHRGAACPRGPRAGRR